MEHVLKLTDEQLNLVGAGLAELPFKVAHPVMMAIQAQVDAAQPKAKASPPKGVTAKSGQQPGG